MYNLALIQFRRGGNFATTVGNINQVKRGRGGGITDIVLPHAEQINKSSLLAVSPELRVTKAL